MITRNNWLVIAAYHFVCLKLWTVTRTVVILEGSREFPSVVILCLWSTLLHCYALPLRCPFIERCRWGPLWEGVLSIEHHSVTQGYIWPLVRHAEQYILVIWITVVAETVSTVGVHIVAFLLEGLHASKVAILGQFAAFHATGRCLRHLLLLPALSLLRLLLWAHGFLTLLIVHIREDELLLLLPIATFHVLGGHVLAKGVARDAEQGNILLPFQV